MKYLLPLYSRLMRIVFRVATAVFVCQSTLAAAQSSAPITQRLDSVVRDNLAKDQAIGAVVLVMKDKDTLLFRGFGKSDVEANTPMATDAIFGIGSITKQFTAAAILKLRDAKKLSLDDDITKWLPDFPAAGNQISLRRLLTHTSGVGDLEQMPNLRPFLRNGALPADSMYAVIRSYPLRFTPGGIQVYSNPAYWLLYRIVEKASGMSYAQYLQTQIFDPLGMTSTGFCLSAESYPRRATGYGVRNGNFRKAPLNTETLYMGSGVLCSSAADMATWLRALHGGQVLSPASYAEMMKPATLSDGTVTRYGMGVEVATDGSGNRYVGHSGELTGYASRANWYPDTRTAVVVLMNNSGDASPSAMAESLAALVAPTRLPATRGFTGDATALTGTYRGMARGGNMTVAVEKNGAALTISVNGGAPRALSWTSGLTFENGGDLFTFRQPLSGNGAAIWLGYDDASGYYVLSRVP